MSAERRQPTQHQIDTIRANTAKDAAKLLGISVSTVYDICHDSNIDPVWVRKGASKRNWGTQFREIRDRWAVGDITMQAMCELYKLRPSDIAQRLTIRSPIGAAKYLTKPELDWVSFTCPAGMSVNEYIASFIRDAYMEENA
jgi:hypothetical protein